MEEQVRARGYIQRTLRKGYGYVKAEDGEIVFIHISEFRKAQRPQGARGLFRQGTYIEFTKVPGHPARVAVQVKVLS